MGVGGIYFGSVGMGEDEWWSVGNGTVRRRRFGDAVSATDFSAIDTSAMGHFSDRHFGDWTFRRCT